MVKNLPGMQETQVQSLGRKDLEKEMATHYSILAQRIPWTEEPGELQSMGSQRIRHDWMTCTHTHTHIQNLKTFINNIIHKIVCFKPNTCINLMLDFLIFCSYSQLCQTNPLILPQRETADCEFPCPCDCLYNLALYDSVSSELHCLCKAHSSIHIQMQRLLFCKPCIHHLIF